MKTFDEIYKELQNGNNSELNNAWKEAKKESEKNKKIAGTICLIIDILFIIMFLKNAINSGSLFFMLYMIIFSIIINVIIFGVVTAISGVSKKQRQFNTKYKNIVIKKIISNFYSNLEYFPHKPMPEYIYEQLKYECYNKYKSDDYFEAQIDNKYSIQMAEILTEEEKTYKDSDGNTVTEKITKFHGLFAKIIMDKSINSELIIMQNGKMILEKNKLEMDSSEFEKYFDVKASNSIIGMQLLTADVMEELVQFENKTNMKFDIFIKGNELYLRFHSGAMFEIGNLSNGALDRNTIQKYFYMLNFTYNLSNRLISIVNDTQI